MVASPRLRREERCERLSNIGSGLDGESTLRRSRCRGNADAPGVNWTRPHTGVRRTPSPMILLHVAAAALYALTVGALWPSPAPAAADPVAVARGVGFLAAARRARAPRLGRRPGHGHRARARFLAAQRDIGRRRAARCRGVGVRPAAHGPRDRSDHPADCRGSGAAAGAAARTSRRPSRIRTVSPTAPSRSPRCTSPSRSSRTRCSSSPRCSRWS